MELASEVLKNASNRNGNQILRKSLPNLDEDDITYQKLLLIFSSGDHEVPGNLKSFRTTSWSLLNSLFNTNCIVKR